MRTVPFRSVYEPIVRRMGYNPRGDMIKEDVANNVLTHINDRVRYIWPLWEWPELDVIEWRAFRTVWVLGQQFHTGDDLYYFGDGVTPPPANAQQLPSNWPGPNEGYYNCKLTAPTGTPPTNATYFQLYGSGTTPPFNEALLDRYIAYSQTNQNVIGELLDVYDSNPRVNRCSRILTQAPSSKGIDVHLTANNIVWIKYRIPVSQFTVQPFIPGFTKVGDPYYDPGTGNCFLASADTNAPSGFPAAPHQGSDTVIPFPFFLAGYVKPAAYADSILETTMEAQMRVALAQQAYTEAAEYLQMEVDKLATQGQRFFYPAFPSRHKHHQHRDIAAGAIPTEVFTGFS